MVIHGEKYGGACRCGRSHTAATKLAVIQNGCMEDFDQYMGQAGLQGKRAAVYDENTYCAAGLRRPRAQREIVLPAEDLHADETSAARALARLDGDTRVVVAVGGGVVTDIARYCAAQRGLDFVSCPTAASVDGFCSDTASMTLNGLKTTVQCVAPTLVLADLEVIRQAPSRLALSGVGDMIGKYVALLDWNAAHLLAGEFICPVIEDMARQAVTAVRNACTGLKKQAPEAFERLTYGLLLSGLAMQMMGNSRPAAGAEHYVSHFLDVRPAGLPTHSAGLHGEQVGVAAAMVAGALHRWAGTEDIRPRLHAYSPAPDALLEGIFGPRLLPGVLEENKNECLAGIAPEAIAERWPEIRRMIGELPTQEDLTALYRAIGAKSTLEDIGVDGALLPDILRYSPYVRNRLTLVRVGSMFFSIP